MFKYLPVSLAFLVGIICIGSILGPGRLIIADHQEPGRIDAVLLQDHVVGIPGFLTHHLVGLEVLLQSRPADLSLLLKVIPFGDEYQIELLG